MITKIHRGLQAFAELLLSYPALIFGGLIISALGSLVLARGLKFDFSPQSIYRGNDELLAYSEDFKRTFGYDDAVLLVLIQSTGAEDVLSVQSLQWQADFVEKLRVLPSVVRVDSLATIEAPRLTTSGLALRPLIDQLTIDQSASDRIRTILENSQLVRGGMLSHDARLATVPIFLSPDLRDIEGLKKTVKEVEAILKQYPPPSQYRIMLSGLPAIRIQIVEDLARDMSTLIPIGGFAYLIVLVLMFRCLQGALLPLCAVGIGLTWTLATFALTHDSFNLVSNVLPILLMIIGVSSCVQILICYSEESSSGLDQWTAARDAITKMAAPCLLAALTTAVGFASLFTARSELLCRFGWQAAIGIAFQYISTLLTLGTLFRYCPPPTYVGMNESRPALLTRTVAFLGHTVARHAWLTIGCATAILAVAVWLGSHVVINTYAVAETFTDSHPTIHTLRLIERELSGIMQLEISLTAKEPGSFLKPEIFHDVIKLEEEAKVCPGVLDVQSYADLYREVLHGWPGRHQTDTDLELVPLSEVGQTRLERTDEFADRFSDAFHYHTYISEDGMRARIRIRLREISSREMLDVIRSLEEKAAMVFPAGSPIETRITGDGCVNAKALTILIRDLFYSLLTASLVIFTLISLEFRSIHAGLIAALPNLTPLATTLGYMGLRGYEMNVGNVIAFTICLGLADDNTIYFLYRFRQELDACGDTIGAVRRAFLGTGRAIVLTSILLLVGMSVLLYSDFVPTRRFAELTIVTIVGNLLGVLLMLPACLVLFWKKPVKTPTEPVPCLAT